ncbi:hypothetical protein [Corallococcus sp. AS-1-6]|uniref:hypothetical protein n=1 Tax=Corallococcus sp. AS-1-6 TaxID=2874599 RepID=UPI001CBD01C1|nr:hypothetical protein [Corallococcus sp. AS-1-6]MBZ4371504.1 hypothetical protein [Corallococcus sp. AS-1-6]
MTLTPKPPTRKRKSPTYAFRPPDDQDAWLSAKLDAGWSQTAILTEVLALHLRLDSALDNHADAIEAYRQREGLMPRYEGDTAGLHEALARLMVRGLEAEGLLKPAKKGGRG